MNQQPELNLHYKFDLKEIELGNAELLTIVLEDNFWWKSETIVT